jgi:hypothetical protein
MSNGSICGVFVASASNSMLLETHVGPDLRHRNCGGQVSHSHQVVSRAGQSKDPVHFAHPAMPNLPHERYRLQPAEAFFDSFPLLLADGVTRMPRGAAINRAAPASSQVLRHLRRHAQMAALLHKTERVEPFVAAHRQRLRAGKPLHHDQRRIAFRCPVRLEDFRVYDQSVAVLHQQISAVTQPGLLPLAFARQQRLGIGLGLVGLVRALLPVKVHRGIAGIIRRRSRLALLWLKALQTCPGFQQRAVHGEMFVRGQPLSPRLRYHACQKLLGHIRLQQAGRGSL